MMTTTNHSPKPLTPKERKDLKVLALFTSVWCRAHHPGAQIAAAGELSGGEGIGLEAYPLCGECREFLAYAILRRRKCPLDPKPACKGCHLHCYRPGHRERVREIMRFSGRHLILRGRLDLLWHYFF